MIGVYDNGRSLMGTTHSILNYINRQLELEPLDEDTTEFYVEVRDELESYDNSNILIINYDNPMGYDIEVFRKEDRIDG